MHQLVSRSGKRPDDISSAQIQANLLWFGRALRDAGMPIGSGQVMNLLEALATIDTGRKDDVYAAAKATLVTRPEQIELFNTAFYTFWRRLTHPMPPKGMPDDPGDGDEPQSTMPQDQPEKGKEKKERNRGETGEAESDKKLMAVEDSEGDDSSAEDYETPPDDVMVFSAREALRNKDFAQFTPEEINEARRLFEKMTWKLPSKKSRRREKSAAGELFDYRRTLRRSMRHQGVPVELFRRRRREKMRPLVLICDISGSMDRYSRLLLRFVHAMEHGLDNVEVFVFSTRLTRITRELRKRDVDVAVADVAKTVHDWSGGTRIGESIKMFNYKWSRRVLRSGATVIMISDGWDRGDPKLLATEMARLQRSCRRLIWLNPLLGAPGYQPLTQGIRAALPYVDAFLPIHNLKSLDLLGDVLEDVADNPPVRRQASISGPNATRLPSAPQVGRQGDMVIKVGPMIDGKASPKRYGP